MACRCGTQKCRGTIGDFADLPAPIKGYYARNRAVLPFLQKR